MYIRIFSLLLIISFSYSQCDDHNQSQCNNDDSCDWIEDIEQGICDLLDASECIEIENTTGECWWYGGSYYGPYCYGSFYEIDNSYCEDIPYILGDINNDGFINILDVIETINYILSNQYNVIVDMNHDSRLDILDVIQIIHIILDS